MTTKTSMVKFIASTEKPVTLFGRAFSAIINSKQISSL